MKRGLSGVLLVVLLAPYASAQGQADCTQRAREITDQLALTGAVAQPTGPLLIAFDRAVQGVAACPSDEVLWYLFLRTGELGSGTYPVTLAGTEASDLQSAALLARQRFPHSSRIATVLARLSGSVEAARQAVSADPAYPPARVALGAALLKAGDAQGACEILDATSDLNRIPGAYTLLARARLAAADAQGAIDAAALEPKRVGNSIEPGGNRNLDAREATEVEGLGYVASGRFDKGACLLLRAAAQGSSSARGALENPGPDLQHSLARVERG